MASIKLLEEGTIVEFSTTGAFALKEAMIWEVLARIKKAKFKYICGIKIYNDSEGWWVTVECVLPVKQTVTSLKEELYKSLWDSLTFTRSTYLECLTPSDPFYKAEGKKLL